MRALSIHTDPYQALKINTQQSKTKTAEKWKWEKLKVGIQNQKFCFLTVPTMGAKSWASCKEPLTSTKCWSVWIKILILMKIEPLPPQLLQPLRAPPAGLFASSPAPQSRSLSSGGDLLPGHKQTNYQNCRSNAKSWSWSPNGRKIGEKRSHLPGNF